MLTWHQFLEAKKKPKQPKRGAICPKCGSKNTQQLTNYGNPVSGRWRCFDCIEKRGGNGHFDQK